MIKLENVSTDSLINYAKETGKNNKVFYYIYKLLYTNNIKDYQMLKAFLESENKELDYECVSQILTAQLDMVISRINNANLTGKDPEIFTFDNYKDTRIDDRTLRITDNANKGGILLYNSPVLIHGARLNHLRNLSIAEIKHLLEHLDDYRLTNTFANIRDFGLETSKKVANAVDFYEQQVLRQAQETDQNLINLFTLNKSAKDEIVESEIEFIAEYIVDNAKECIWGKLTDTQKRKIMTAAKSTRGEFVQKDRKSLIDAISNYTTLGELEQGVIKKRTLDRFIVR